MKKSFGFIIAMALLATPAIAQIQPGACAPVFPLMDIRPGACAPVFPLMDKVAAAPIPQDVTVAQAAPAAAARRGFFGLPFLPLLLAGLGAGGIAALSGGDSGTTVSPA
jgi:hypothetical protein